MPRIRNTAGFALPATILIVALLTVMLTAGFTRLRVDRQLTHGTDATLSALSVAQSGLEAYLGATNVDVCQRPIRPLNGDSVRINVTGGYAWVSAWVAQRPADTLNNWLYLIRSTGYVINPLEGTTPQARRTVAQFAEWQRGVLGIQAAFTAANGLTRASGGTGEFHGVDENTSSCRDAPINAVRVPAGEGPSDKGGYDTTGVTPMVLESGTGMDVALATEINWAATVAGGITPDYTTIQFDDWNYPIVVVTGDATFGVAGGNTYGTGLLIVTGQLNVIGAFDQWYGVVLVGDRIVFNADDQRFDGYVVAGLNEALGTSISKTQIGGGVQYLDIDYNTSYIRQAMARLAGFIPLEHTWIDNWASF